MNKIVITDNPNLPLPRTPYAQVVRKGNLVFMSGAVGRLPEGHVAKGDLVAQFRQALTNTRVALEAVGVKPEDVVQITLYLIDMKQKGLLDKMRCGDGRHRGGRVNLERARRRPSRQGCELQQACPRPRKLLRPHDRRRFNSIRTACSQAGRLGRTREPFSSHRERQQSPIESLWIGLQETVRVITIDDPEVNDGSLVFMVQYWGQVAESVTEQMDAFPKDRPLDLDCAPSSASPVPP